MSESKRHKGRLLTTKSLALAAILSLGAGTAFAGNTTVRDGGAITETGDPGVAITITGVTEGQTTASITEGTSEGSQLGANGDVETIELGGADTLEITLHGDGKKALVENTETNKAIDVALKGATGKEAKLIIAGQGGVLADVTGTGSADNTLEIVGDDGTGARVEMGDVSGITIKIDPAIVSTNTVGDDVLAGVGQESMWLIGGTLESESWASKLLNKELGITGSNYNDWTNSKLRGQEITAIMAVGKTTVIDENSGYEIDGLQDNTSLNPQKGEVSFAADSLLVIDAARLENGVVFQDKDGGDITAQIDDESSLYLVNGRVGETSVFKNFEAIGDGAAGYNDGDGIQGWETANYDTRLLSGKVTVRENSDGTFDAILDTKYNGAASSRANGGFGDGKISGGMAGAVDGVFKGKMNDVDSADAGLRFISRATSSLYLDHGMANDSQVVKTMEGAAAMAALAGVQTGSYSIVGTTSDQYNARLSYLRDTAPAAGSEPGTAGIWVNPFYNFSKVDGAKIGRHSAEYDISYGGGSIGVDTNINESVRLGVAASVGGGSTESKGGGFNKTESDLDFWGIGVYGSYTNGLFGLTGDLGYTGASYDIDQRQSIMNKFTADVDTQAFTIGLNGEYRFMTENCLNIIPHVGLRYTNLKTDSYRVKEKGTRQTVFRVDSERQNIWTFPLGVTFTGDVETGSGWVIKPMADLGVIFAAGDLDADSKFHVGNTDIRNKVTTDDVVDAVTFNGLLGLKADAGDGFSVGLDYNLKASGNLTSHGLTGMIRYEF